MTFNNWKSAKPALSNLQVKSCKAQQKLQLNSIPWRTTLIQEVLNDWKLVKLTLLHLCKCSLVELKTMLNYLNVNYD